MKPNACDRFGKPHLGILEDNFPIRTEKESREKTSILSQKIIFLFQKERHTNHKYTLSLQNKLQPEIESCGLLQKVQETKN
jgi:hypothetical protein